MHVEKEKSCDDGVRPAAMKYLERVDAWSLDSIVLFCGRATCVDLGVPAAHLNHFSRNRWSRLPELARASLEAERCVRGHA